MPHRGGPEEGLPVAAGGHDCAVITMEDLVEAVDQRFAVRPPELAVWPDPHDGHPPADGEYSRATNPERWRILGARVDAWVAALVAAGLASVEQVAVDDIRWEESPHTRMSSAMRVIPSAMGARPMVVARSQIGDVPETGITLGWGDPAVPVGLFPYCGCDACDGGAQRDLDSVDDRLSSIVSGGYRRLNQGDRQVDLEASYGWSAAGEWADGEVEAVLADPTGWDELSGATWLA
jgi:hypothetical protein